MNTVKDYEDNIMYILENWIPKDCVVRVREGGGPEDLNQSLTASLSKMMDFYDIPRSFIVRNREADAALATKDAEIANRPFTAAQLKDPGIVLVNMQHGTIATPQRFLNEQAYSNKLQDEITCLTALNTAKGELIEWYSNHVVGAFGSKGIQKHNELRARIRSLEDES